MKCEYCQKEIPKLTIICPYCGKAKTNPPTNVPQLICELHRLKDHFSQAEAYHKKKDLLNARLKDGGEFTTGCMGIFFTVVIAVFLLIGYFILSILAFFHVEFLSPIYSFFSQFDFNNIFWGCIGIAVCINIINRILHYRSKQKWEKELLEIKEIIEENFMKAQGNFIDFKYARPIIIEKLIQYIQENRAHTYEDALNLYVQEEKYKRLKNHIENITDYVHR